MRRINIIVWVTERKTIKDQVINPCWTYLNHTIDPNVRDKVWQPIALACNDQIWNEVSDGCFDITTSL